jgi:hypothetical protein
MTFFKKPAFAAEKRDVSSPLFYPVIKSNDLAQLLTNQLLRNRSATCAFHLYSHPQYCHLYKIGIERSNGVFEM